MFFWQTKKLAQSLKNDELEQAEYMNYYLATTIITIICLYLTGLEQPETFYPIFFEAIGIIIVTIVGLKVVFIANGGNSGVSYLDRVISLSFPLLIKFSFAGIGLAIIIEIIYEFAIVDSQQMDWIYSFAVILIEAMFFWRVNYFVKFINE